MATEMINLRLEHSFLKEIDVLVKQNHYQSRTEYIREALRKSIEAEKNKTVITQLMKLKGSSKQTTSDEQYELTRKKVFEELCNQFK